MLGIRLYICFLLLSSISAAQDTLSGSYKKLMLEEGVYYINGTVSIDSSLTVNPGVTILFSEGSSLLCLGKLFILGSPQQRVVFQNRGEKKGNGIVIKGQQDQDSVLIRYCQFIGLSSVLRFESNWIRKNVTVSHCEFLNNNLLTPVITVMTPRYEVGVDTTTVDFLIEQSVFSKNGPGLYFEDLQTRNVAMQINSNLFIGNKISDFGIYNVSGNILYGRADKIESVNTTRITGNSFLQNYLYSSITDTMLQRISVGVFGSADSINATQNFWGSDQIGTTRKAIYDYYTNYTSPRFTLEPLLTTPLSTSPPHIYRVCTVPMSGSENIADCSVLEEQFAFHDLSGIKLALKANRPISAESAEIIYTWLTDSLQEQSRSLVISVQSVNEGQDHIITIDSLLQTDFGTGPGYLSIVGFRGPTGETIPPLTIGYKTFSSAKFEKLQKKNNGSSGLKDISGIQNSTFDSLAVFPSFADNRKSRFYIYLSGNISDQRINDRRPLQQYIFPLDAVNSSYLQPGFSAGLRWDRNIFKSFSANLMLSYTYLRAAQKVNQLFDTLLPYANRFTSFMPRSHFELLGVNGGLQAKLTPSFLVQGGGALELNLKRSTWIDRESPSYKAVLYSVYTGIEVALPHRNQFTMIWMGLRWRHLFSSIAIENVRNTIDAVEIYSAIDFSVFKLNLKRRSK